MKSVTFGQLWAVIGLGLMCITNQSYAKEYYKWVDARGVTTYSATPPPTQKKEPQLDPLKKNTNAVSAGQATAMSNSAAVKDTKSVNPTSAIPTNIVNKPVVTASNDKLNAVSEVLTSIKSCNGVRCWDAKGKIFNLVAGNTYLSSTGGKCQKISNNMRCSK
ncbi:DUF4124 domain-containing protein [bacterium SPL81]|nr:DUF4124 domain-containing protein [Acinetobacter baumannii]